MNTDLMVLSGALGDVGRGAIGEEVKSVVDGLLASDPRSWEEALTHLVRGQTTAALDALAAHEDLRAQGALARLCAGAWLACALLEPAKEKNGAT